MRGLKGFESSHIPATNNIFTHTKGTNASKSHFLNIKKKTVCYYKPYIKLPTMHQKLKHYMIKTGAARGYKRYGGGLSSLWQYPSATINSLHFILKICKFRNVFITLH